MIIDQLFTRPIFEAADPSRLIATITLSQAYNADEPTKEVDLTGRFQGDVKSQMNQAADYLTQFLQSKGFNFTSIQLKYQGMVMNAQNRGSMTPQSDWEKEAEATANQMRAKRSVQNTAPALKEFAPSDDDSNGSDPEEMLRRMASHWWNGTERQMAKVENTLAAMGWEIGQDEGYDDGGVFVVRAGDEHGRTYTSWSAEELDMNEAAPPGARAERMVRHIKQGYAKDGKLTPKEKGIAFATAWKAHNAGRVEEGEITKNATGLKHRATDKYGAGDDEPHHYTGGRSGFSEPGKYARDLEHVNKQLVKDLDASMGISWKNRGTKGIEVDEQGVTEAAQGHTIEAHGVRGMDRRTWHKTFKNTDQMIAWAEKHDAEIIGTRDLEQARHHNLSPARQGVAEGLTEMDKSEPSAGRDGPPRPGPDREAKPISKEKMTKDAADVLDKAMSKEHKKKDVTESDTLMLKLQRAMVQEGRVKELADDLKTMPDADFMKKYGKVKAVIRKDMSRIDEKLSTSDTLSRPAASASLSGKAIDDPDIMGSLKSASTPKFDRFSKTDSEPKIDFRAGLVGGEPEVEANPRFMVDPLPDMQKWGGKFATGSAGGDNRFTAPAGWRYVEKDEDPARYGSAPAAAAAGGGLPDLKYDPQSRTLKSADALALDLSPKSKFKFDRATQSQVSADGSGGNPNIDNATRDRARAWAAKQNAPADAAKQKVDWKTIYALNKATIGSNPNVIRPRMELNMPNGTIYLVQPGDTLTKIAAKQSQINELSTEKLAQYKTASARDARQADQEGDVKRGNKRFSGIVKATKKQFDNDAKKVDESRAARRALMAKIVNGN